MCGIARSLDEGIPQIRVLCFTSGNSSQADSVRAAGEHSRRTFSGRKTRERKPSVFQRCRNQAVRIDIEVHAEKEDIVR